MTLAEAYRKLEDVRDEFDAASFALRRTFDAYAVDPLIHQETARQRITFHDLQSCIRNLPITYFLRMFAEFEGILRDYWAIGRGRTTAPTMSDLMNSVAAYRFMRNDDVQDAHEIREYCNEVIHEHLQDPRFDFQTSRSRLARFIRWLPQRW